MKRRIIRPVPQTGIEPVPPQGVFVDGQLDYIEETPEGEPHKDAIYVAEMDKTGKVTEPKKPSPDYQPKHVFGGWRVDEK